MLLDNLLIHRGELTVAHLTYGENATKWSDIDNICTNNIVQFFSFQKSGPYRLRAFDANQVMKKHIKRPGGQHNDKKTKGLST